MFRWRNGAKTPSDSSVKSVGDAMKIDQFKVAYDPRHERIAISLVADSNYAMRAGDELTVYLGEDQVNHVLAQMFEALAKAHNEDEK